MSTIVWIFLTCVYRTCILCKSLCDLTAGIQCHHVLMEQEASQGVLCHIINGEAIIKVGVLAVSQCNTVCI